MMQKELTALSDLVLDVLKGYQGTVFQQETIDALLKTKDNIFCEENQEISSHKYCSDKVSSDGGYPDHPLYLKLSRTLCEWMQHGKSVLRIGESNLESLEENESPIKEEISKVVDLKLKFLQRSWDNISISETKRVIEEILEMLQLRGILDLIGMRQTTGSVNVFPPHASLLWKSFKEKHKPGANLSCGARALSKHCHRDRTSQRWGISTGSEHEKNTHADRVLEKIFGDVVWINIHMLPHNIQVLEVRDTFGYGARWSHDGKTFRGFLEPQMHDGHTVGWRH